MAPVADAAVIGDGTHVVLGEVKACDADVIAVYRGSGAHGGVVLAPCVGIAVLTGAGVGLQRDIRGGASGRKGELGEMISRTTDSSVRVEEEPPVSMLSEICWKMLLREPASAADK